MSETDTRHTFQSQSRDIIYTFSKGFLRFLFPTFPQPCPHVSVYLYVSLSVYACQTDTPDKRE